MLLWTGRLGKSGRKTRGLATSGGLRTDELFGEGEDRQWKARGKDNIAEGMTSKTRSGGLEEMQGTDRNMEEERGWKQERNREAR